MNYLKNQKLNRFIRRAEKLCKPEKVVLIENEFGEINIDSGFLKDSGIQITEMSSGCICCTGTCE